MNVVCATTACRADHEMWRVRTCRERSRHARRELVATMSPGCLAGRNIPQPGAICALAGAHTRLHGALSHARCARVSLLRIALRDGHVACDTVRLDASSCRDTGMSRLRRVCAEDVGHCHAQPDRVPAPPRCASVACASKIVSAHTCWRGAAPRPAEQTLPAIAIRVRGGERSRSPRRQCDAD